MSSLIKQGSKGADVKTWQKVIGVTADGQFGSGTTAATKKWQSEHGLTPDGVVGPATWAAASAAQAASSGVPMGPQPMLTQSTAPTLRQGSSGEYVKKWQMIIGVTPDGQFGPTTKAKTQVWQRGHGIVADGIVGPLSWTTANASMAVATALPAVAQSVMAAAQNPAAINIPTYVPQQEIDQSVYTPPTPSSSSLASILPPIKTPSGTVQSEQKPVQQSLVDNSYTLPNLPTGGASIQIPGVGNASLSTTSPTTITTQETAAKRKQILIYGGIGVGALLIGYLLLKSTKKEKSSSSSKSGERDTNPSARYKFSGYNPKTGTYNFG
jgi:peptidoglycan hydrolase-like protein with peptidoglycan-binding domain